MSTATQRGFLALVSSVALAAVLGDTLTALNTSPAVNIRRIASLNQAVWAGDFNGDGIIDLVGSEADVPGVYPDTAVRIALGNGDGTFRSAVNTPFAGRVLGVGDLNHDAKLDVVVAWGYLVYALAGNGDGTLNAQHAIDGSGFDALGFAIVADFDGDANLDVAVESFEETHAPELRVSVGVGTSGSSPPYGS